MRPRVKICGVRSGGDAQLAVELGATHIGCVLASDSPRCATIDEARRLASGVTDAQVILVFRKPSADEVVDVSAEVGVSHVQVHGVDEQFYVDLEAKGLTAHRVYSVSKDAGALPRIEATEGCPAFLDVGRGGAGVPFDWSLMRRGAPAATFIAGGITPENISTLLEQRPWGVDVSSGVESSPGVKDPDKLRRLFAVLAEVTT